MLDSLTLYGAIARLRVDGNPALLYLAPVYWFPVQRWFARKRRSRLEPWDFRLGVHVIDPAGEIIDPVDDSEIAVENLEALSDPHATATVAQMRLTQTQWLDPWQAELVRRESFGEVPDENLARDGSTLTAPEFYHLRGAVAATTDPGLHLAVWPVSRSRLLLLLVADSGEVRWRFPASTERFLAGGPAGLGELLPGGHHVGGWLSPAAADDIRRRLVARGLGEQDA